MKGRITEKGKAVVELMEHEGISLEEALERMDPPAGRGDVARPDPAMIERAAATFHEAYGRLAVEHGFRVQPDNPTSFPWEAVNDDLRGIVRGAIGAAAGVIVPATAEAIAAAIEATQVNNAPQFAAIARSFAVPEGKP